MSRAIKDIRDSEGIRHISFNLSEKDISLVNLSKLIRELLSIYWELVRLYRSKSHQLN